MEQVLFLILAAGSILGAANVVFRRNPAICAVFLVLTFVCLSGMFLMLGFPFVAAVQLMVYAGAIMVLFLFVVMLLNLNREQPRDFPYGPMLAPLLAGCLLGLLAPVFVEAKVHPISVADALPRAAGVRAAEGGLGLAEALFGRFLLPFEAVSLLLLASIIGVIVLAKRSFPAPAPRGPGAESGAAPLGGGTGGSAALPEAETGRQVPRPALRPAERVGALPRGGS